MLGSSVKCPDCGWADGHAPGCSLGPRAKRTPNVFDRPDAGAVIRHVASLASGERERQHGEKLKHFRQAAALWSAYTGTDISASDVAQMLSLLKVARSKSGSFNPDDYIDQAGYAGIACELIQKDA